MTLRPQYHFRPTAEGTLIWNIPHLEKLARDLPTIEVPLVEIRELDEPYWFAATNNEPTCRAIADHMKLVDAADMTYPVILCAEGWVMDGMHRVVKALIQRRESIRARRFSETPPHDFVDVNPDDLPYE